MLPWHVFQGKKELESTYHPLQCFMDWNPPKRNVIFIIKGPSIFNVWPLSHQRKTTERIQIIIQISSAHLQLVLKCLATHMVNMSNQLYTWVIISFTSFQWGCSSKFVENVISGREPFRWFPVSFNSSIVWTAVNITLWLVTNGSYSWEKAKSYKPQCITQPRNK